jgi:hypothetical protein
MTEIMLGRPLPQYSFKRIVPGQDVAEFRVLGGDWHTFTENRTRLARLIRKENRAYSREKAADPHKGFGLVTVHSLNLDELYKAQRDFDASRFKMRTK